MGMTAAALISLLITGGYPTLAITCLPRYYALGRENLVRAFHAAFCVMACGFRSPHLLSPHQIYLWLPLSDAIKTALRFGCLSAPAAVAIRINIIALGAILVYVAGAIIFRPWALRVFGAEYEVGHWPLVLFMVS